MRASIALALALLVTSPSAASAAFSPPSPASRDAPSSEGQWVTKGRYRAFIRIVPVAGEQFACPMHPERTAEHAARCTACGMPMERQSHRVTVATGEGALAAPAPTYICPMHPNVTSDKPGACTECGMPLEERRVDVSVGDYANPRWPLAARQAFIGAPMRLVIKGHGDEEHTATLGGDGNYQANFRLAPGSYTVTAIVKPSNAAQEVEFTVPLEVR